MARERVITRTITSINYACLTVNMDTKQVEEITVTIPSANALTDKAKEKAIKAALPPMNPLVKVMAEKEIEQLYGMPESEFMKYAKPMPNRPKAE